jgi:ABC-2 type transport system permease protein
VQDDGGLVVDNRAKDTAVPLDVPDTIMRQFFDSISSMLLFIIPIITMGLLAEEKKRGTMELLLTSPISDLQIILGKYFAALSFFIAMLMPTTAYSDFSCIMAIRKSPL